MAIVIKCKTYRKEPKDIDVARDQSKNQKPYKGVHSSEVEAQIKQAVAWIKIHYNDVPATEYPYENGDLAQRVLNIYEAYQASQSTTPPEDLDITCGESNWFASIAIGAFKTTPVAVAWSSDEERDKMFQAECDAFDWENASEEDALKMKEYLNNKYFS